ncbi:MAG: bifunctional aspartate kinase/diaminopimelate decarboxylase [Proteobacteria bacterium]|nr:bifunctional aspartate kinase/diaminopimelate decarboxylase [Pseudomonadota bacterium]
MVAQAQRWVVLKFGGTSVSRRDRWDTIGQLAAKRAAGQDVRVLVVVSALSGVTNELQAICNGDDIDARIAALVERHRAFCAELGLDGDIVLGERLAALQALARDPRASGRTLAWQAEVLGQGELLSSTLGAAYLASQGMDVGWCDARDWLQAIALPNQSDWATRLAVNCRREGDADFAERFARQPARMLITQGFIARHGDGGTAVLGRGGSDTSAGYFGALLQAQCVEIWTDVPGMFSANPREVPEARLLTRLDYAEAQEIATTGAKVLHPRSIAPCRDAGVPMKILDTERPDLPGTRIDASAITVPGVKAISRRNGIVLVSMESIGMWQQVGFLADIFERFRAHGLSVDLIGSAETNVTVSLDPSENLVSGNVLEALAADLSQVCRVKVIAPCAAITLVGRGMRSLLHRLSDTWATFGRERVHLISQSSNDLNLTFVIDEADADGLLPQLHAELIRGGAMPVREASVFGPSWHEIAHGRPQRRTPWWVGAQAGLLAKARAGTPRYVYDPAVVRERARELSGTTAIDRCYYAIKANPHPAILRTLADEGFGLECVSLGELEHVFATCDVDRVALGGLRWLERAAPLVGLPLGQAGGAHGGPGEGRVGVDHALECVGNQQSLDTALGVVRDGGGVGYVGVPAGVKGLNLGTSFRRNVTLAGGIAPARAYIPELLEDVLAGRLDPAPVLDQAFPLDDVPAAYAAMQDRKVIKAMILV